MKVKLLDTTPLWLCANAIRMSHDNNHLSDSEPPEIGSKDLDLIHRVGNKLKHKSVLEMAVVNLEIKANNNEKKIVQQIREYPYIPFVELDNYLHILCSINLRALQDLDIPIEYKIKFTPEEYHYLIEH